MPFQYELVHEYSSSDRYRVDCHHLHALLSVCGSRPENQQQTTDRWRIGRKTGLHLVSIFKFLKEINLFLKTAARFAYRWKHVCWCLLVHLFLEQTWQIWLNTAETRFLKWKKNKCSVLRSSQKKKKKKVSPPRSYHWKHQSWSHHRHPTWLLCPGPEKQQKEIT